MAKIKIFEKTLLFFAKKEIFFCALVWLMILLVFGTIAQKYLGLYQATQKYFSSYFFKFYFLYLPAGWSIMIIIFFGLLARVILDDWKLANLGIIITHLGALLLLFGGFLFANLKQEGNMVIREGQTVNYISDYYKTELAIIKDAQDIAVFSLLNKKDTFVQKNLPFKIFKTKFYKNCFLEKRNSDQEKNFLGMAKIFKFKKAVFAKQSEKNIACLSFRIESKKNKEINGFYGIFQYMPIKQSITINQQKYFLEIRNKRQYLPFKVKLIEFSKKNYNNSNIAKSYSSEIIVSYKNTNWNALIEMNKPFRYKGYSIYQSSFIKDEQGEVSIFAVVQNIARLFPYIASIIMCLGVFIALIQRIK